MLNTASYCTPMSTVSAGQHRNEQVAGAPDTVYGSEGRIAGRRAKSRRAARVFDGGSAYHVSNYEMPGSAMEDIAPILHVTDARASIDWYAQLGFGVEWQHAFEPGLPLYVSVWRGPAHN
jgi:hypothetical protein